MKYSHRLRLPIRIARGIVRSRKESGDLLGLACVDLAAEASGCVALEEAGEDWLEKRAEDDLGATANRVSGETNSKRFTGLTQSVGGPSTGQGRT